VNQIIFDELVLGKVTAESRAHYQRIAESLVARGAEGVILGCTEIGLLLQPEHCPFPLFDTTEIHAASAVREALSLGSIFDDGSSGGGSSGGGGKA
jgi:aspartate racemase